MTLDTRIYVAGKIGYRDVFVKCNQIIGANEGTRFKDDDGMIWNMPGQGLCALMDVRYGTDGPLRDPGDHARYCDGDADGCDGDCAAPCWLEVSFDTAYGYSGPEGGCGDLHARLVAELGHWLDGKGIRWSWRNEFTGDIHQGYEGLEELGMGGLKALEWFAFEVAPAITAMGGEVV